jgi:uncharacterized protein Smg (DUF494 family)
MKSMESLYSSTSSKASTSLHRRKLGLRTARPPGIVPIGSEVRQRIMSAKLLRFKQMQNQLVDAHNQISELLNENKLLKSLHKRQDSALSKYESSNAELPKLLHAHSEEIRVLQTKCRNLAHQNKEIVGKMKQKEAIILSLTDQNKHLVQLNKDKYVSYT